MVVGKENILGDSEYSYIHGNENKAYGRHIYAFGESNEIGPETEPEIPNLGTTDYSANNIFVAGANIRVYGPSSNPLQNVIALGRNHKIKTYDNGGANVKKQSYVLLGGYADISGTTVDGSGIRFAFGTNEMHNKRGGTESIPRGNVFTIDVSGNIPINFEGLQKSEIVIPSNTLKTEIQSSISKKS